MLDTGVRHQSLLIRPFTECLYNFATHVSYPESTIKQWHWLSKWKDLLYFCCGLRYGYGLRFKTIFVTKLSLINYYIHRNTLQDSLTYLVCSFGNRKKLLPMDLVLLFMQLLAAQYCPLPTHRRVEAIANRQPPRPSLGGVRQIDHVAMCGSERSLRSYTIVGISL